MRVNVLLTWGAGVVSFESKPKLSFVCGMSGTGAKEQEKAKGKRKVKQEEDEDYHELPQKKHKLYGRPCTVCPSVTD